MSDNNSPNTQNGDNRYEPGSYSSAPVNSNGQGMTPPYDAGNNSYAYPQQPVYSSAGYDNQQLGKPAGTGLGVASLVLGILALLTSWLGLGIVLALVGLILGIVALSKLKRVPGARKGVAISGTIISAISLIFSVIITIAWIIFITQFASSIDEQCGHLSGNDLNTCITQWTEEYSNN